jgi:hypothetical protein
MKSSFQLISDIVIRTAFLVGFFYFAYQYDKHGTSPDNFQMLFMIVMLSNFFKSETL